MDDWFGLQGGLVAVGLLAAVPGCKDPDPDTDTTIENTTSTESGSTGDTGGTSTSSGTTGDTPTGSGSATGTTGDATTGDVAVPPECVSYGAKFAECFMDPMAAMDYERACVAILMQGGADCDQAYEAYLACLSALSCEEFMGFVLGGLPVCEAEVAALEAAACFEHEGP
jgi:hypothetical protein